MNILFDYQVFLNQVYGGVSRYHVELYKGINNIPNNTVAIELKYACNSYIKEHMHFKDVYRALNKNNILLLKLYAYINQKYLDSKIKKNHFDIIHPTWYSPYIFKYSNKIPIVVTIYDMIHEKFNLTGNNVIERKKNAIYQSDAIIAISESTKRDILEIYPDVPEDKIHVIYLAADIVKSLPANIKFNIPSEYLLYVGRRENYKNWDFFIKSIAPYILSKNIKIIMAGGGAFSEHENKLIDELGVKELMLQKNVTDAELAYLYKNALALVYPSKYEGFGLPVLEAFAQDCPVVCCNTSSLPEVGGDAAFYFELDDKASLITAIDKIYTDKQLTQSMILKGREQLGKFNWDKTVKETLDLYEAIVDSKSRSLTNG